MNFEAWSIQANHCFEIYCNCKIKKTKTNKTHIMKQHKINNKIVALSLFVLLLFISILFISLYTFIFLVTWNAKTEMACYGEENTSCNTLYNKKNPAIFASPHYRQQSTLSTSFCVIQIPDYIWYIHLARYKRFVHTEAKAKQYTRKLPVKYIYIHIWI